MGFSFVRQVVYGGHDMSFDSTVRIVVRRRSRTVCYANIHLGLVGSTEVTSFAMRLQLQMVYKLLSIHNNFITGIGMKNYFKGLRRTRLINNIMNIITCALLKV